MLVVLVFSRDGRVSIVEASACTVKDLKHCSWLCVRRMNSRGTARVKKLSGAVIHINMCDAVAVLVVKKKTEDWSKHDPYDMLADYLLI